ncbi:hypothetical protein LOTGIDRAFT_155075 [Lottia gigantea]|uniref:Uncharacterized protein n=1 Tax=Lottia gigantea TaxID=225164 RepID=V3ZMP6_LOTGI|nr:hypothetical protein LOTGIDRAFT_155075 [Lottia gigantea]ESO85587.1 hypothetical protein LOTGIDRAFT_155075 [Lottia gigantea]
MKYSKLKKKNADVDQRKKRSDATPASTIDASHDHYERPDMSTILPNRKSIAQGQPKHVLQRSVEATFKSFTNDSPSLKISESTFNKLRPKHILLQSISKFYQCLCEPCTNIDLKLKVLNHEVYQCQSTSCSIRDRYHATDLTLCPKDQNPHAKLECIDRKCEICDVDLLDHYLQPLLNVSGDKDVSWQYWGQTTYGNEGKKRVALLRSSGTVKQLVDQLKEELISLSTHLFIARWQQNVFYTITKNPPTNSIVMVMDFAENYLCVMQNEVQSAHWYQMQVTLHPMLCFYRCDTCEKTVREAINIISDDMQHDAHAVRCFVETAVCHLINVRGLNPQRLIKFSDGCSSQYKSKTPFVDLSFAAEDLEIPIVEHHYFGSRHGKNQCDGEGGVVKNAATRAVNSEGIVIANCDDFFQYCIQHLTKASTNEDGSCNHSRRFFYLVRKDQISHDVKPERSGVTTLQGTRLLHSVVCIKPFHLKTRRLSCFCESCENYGSECLNSCYVTKWSNTILKVKKVLLSCNSIIYFDDIFDKFKLVININFLTLIRSSMIF